MLLTFNLKLQEIESPAHATLCVPAQICRASPPHVEKHYHHVQKSMFQNDFLVDVQVHSIQSVCGGISYTDIQFLNLDKTVFTVSPKCYIDIQRPYFHSTVHFEIILDSVNKGLST